MCVCVRERERERERERGGGGGRGGGCVGGSGWVGVGVVCYQEYLLLILCIMGVSA